MPPRRRNRKVDEPEVVDRVEKEEVESPEIEAEQSEQTPKKRTRGRKPKAVEAAAESEGPRRKKAKVDTVKEEAPISAEPAEPESEAVVENGEEHIEDKTKKVKVDKSRAKPAKKAANQKSEGDGEEADGKTPVQEEKKKRVRKSKVTEPEEPLQMRTTSVKMLIGAHVSMAKAISNSIVNANHIGANSFALFLKNQRKWVSPDMKEEDIKDFRDRLAEYKYDPMQHILPHGSYLINLAQDDADKQKQAYDCFLDDLKRCEALNIGRYNFHPGSTASCTREKGIENVAKSINKAIKETKFVKIVIENMAGHGNIIGGPLEELAAIIAQVEDKSRVGVCLDTCHLFAAGHDLRTQEAYDALMEKFDKVVGAHYLAGMHLNDSKADLGANKDLHQNIGLGYLGLEAFRCVMNDKRLEGLPLVLETPSEDENKKEDKSVWATEIKLLEWLIGKKSDDPEVLAKAKELYTKGEGDREKALVAAQKKAARLDKEQRTPTKKRAKKVKDESDAASDED